MKPLPTTLATLLISLVASAQEAPPAEEDVATLLVKRLGSEDPEVRLVAQKDLVKMHRKAMAALRVGATSPDLEIAACSRALLNRIEKATIHVQGGPLAADVPWSQARGTLVSVDFSDTPFSEIAASFKEDLGFTLKVGAGVYPDPSTLVTLKMKDAPLEFLLQTLLHKGLTQAATSIPRFGWGNGVAVLTADFRTTGKNSTVVFATDGELAGIPEEERETLVKYLKARLGPETNRGDADLTEKGLEVVSNELALAEVAILVDDLRRAATGLPALGEELNAEARKAGDFELAVRWMPQTLPEALAELAEKTGTRFEFDPRVIPGGLNQVYYGSPKGVEPVATILRGVIRNRYMLATDVRWGAWWIWTETANDSFPRHAQIRDAATLRSLELIDLKWTLGDMERWLGDSLTAAPAGRGTSTNTAVAWFPSAGILTVSGSNGTIQTCKSILETRRVELASRLAAIEGTPAPVAPLAEAAPRNAMELEERITSRLALQKVTKELTSTDFRGGQSFQEVFNNIHGILAVFSSSGSTGANADSKTTLRACRLKDAPTRALWRWLNSSSIPWFLTYSPSERSAAWGLGTDRQRSSLGVPTTSGRGRIHPEFSKSFQELLGKWNPAEAKTWATSSGVSMSGGTSIRLPMSTAERLLAGVGLTSGSGAGPWSPTRLDLPQLDKEIVWPAGKYTAEEALFRLGELAELNFILDVPRTADTTRKLEMDAETVRAGKLLDVLVASLGATWGGDEDGVCWIRAASEGSKSWVFFDSVAKLGADEATAVAAEFAKSGDELFAFPATGRWIARCDPARAATASETLSAARSAAEAAVQTGLDETVKALQSGGEAPAGLAGALALELAAATSPVHRLALARRLSTQGYVSAAFRQFRLAGDDPASDDEVQIAGWAGAAREAALLGVSDLAMDAEAVRMSRLVEAASDVPPATLQQAVLAGAEAWRRAGNVDESLRLYRRAAELGAMPEDAEAWLDRLAN